MQSASCPTNVAFPPHPSIPFLIRGPGVKTNSTFSELVGNVDIMPTLLELSGGASSIPGFVDGKSLVPVLLQESAIVNPQALQRVRDFKATASWRQHYLVAYKSVGTYFNGLFGEGLGVEVSESCTHSRFVTPLSVCSCRSQQRESSALCDHPSQS